MEKPGKSFKCYLVSWDEAYILGKKLARKIKASGFMPDLVIGIARGGLVPARIVCDFLLQKDLASVKVEHWGIAATLGTAKIKFPLPEEVDISGKKILIVDDIADTGDTYRVIMEHIKKKVPAEIRTAVLQYKTCSTFIPDYWGEKLVKWEWIVYPWAVYEDLTGFINRVLVSPMTHEEIRKSMKSGFDIKISRKELSEFLNDMREEGKLRRGKKGSKFYWESTGET
ncbi:xanthine-guanine phosphoribosyltransferase [groundwater metagenome]